MRVEDVNIVGCSRLVVGVLADLAPLLASMVVEVGARTQDAALCCLLGREVPAAVENKYVENHIHIHSVFFH